MEHDIVFAYEVDDAGFGVFPPCFPSFGIDFLGVGYIADGRVKPHVQHLAVGTLNGHGHTPVEVAAHRTGLQAQVEPRLALSIDIGFPFLVAFENPLAQVVLPAVKGQIPVLGLAHHGNIACYGAARIDKVGGVERGAALLALVAVCALCVAVGALAGDVAVGKELSGLFVVKLHRGLLHKAVVIVQATEKL